MKGNVVVDASVVIKWFVPEPGEAEALQLLDEIRSGDVTAFAPELLLAETANVVWRRAHLAKQMSARTAGEIVAAIGASPVRIESMASLMPEALDIALRSGCTVYDAIYVALAAQVDGTFVTADRKLAAALHSDHLPEIQIVR